MSVNATAAAASFLFSSAHCWIAPSICRKLLMQAFFWEVVRARIKLGIAIAAKRPIMATTIMISTNVKPDLREVLIFILYVFLSAAAWTKRQTGYMIALAHLLPVATALAAWSRA